MEYIYFCIVLRNTQSQYLPRQLQNRQTLQGSTIPSFCPETRKQKRDIRKNVRNSIENYLFISKNNLIYLPRTLLASEPDLRRLNDGSFILIFILYRLLRNFDYLSRRLTPFTAITIWNDV